MKILITGATGTAGAETIRQAIKDPEVQEIVTLSRRPMDIESPKIKSILHKNFLDYSTLNSALAECDVCIWALGVSQTQVSKEEYSIITHDYALAAAEALIKVNPEVRFVFVSGAGADPSEQSKTLFSKIKGRTENDLKKLPLKELYIARPAGIQPIHKNKNMALLNKLVLPFFPLIKMVTPHLVITSVELAKALIYIAKHKSTTTIIDNVQLKKLAQQQT